MAYYTKEATGMIYTDKEKAAIVTLYKQGVSAQSLGLEHNVSARTIYRWVKTHYDISLDEKRTLSTKEYNMLLRRVVKLENIITILKTVNCTVHDPLKEKLGELEQLYGQYDVHTLCNALDVPRGTFDNHPAFLSGHRRHYLSKSRRVSSWAASGCNLCKTLFGFPDFRAALHYRC